MPIINPGGFGWKKPKKFMNKNALIVFLRKPEIGKVKTRLAKDIGDEKTLIIYQKLIEKTIQEISMLKADIYLYFTPEIPKDNLPGKFNLRIQSGNDLGECMKNAFRDCFQKGHDKVIIIGSDCFQISHNLIQSSFEELNQNKFVIGPSEDGGYYLLGMTSPREDIFEDIEWSISSVYACTLGKLAGETIAELPVLNDIDNLEDLKKEPELYSMVMV